MFFEQSSCTISPKAEPYIRGQTPIERTDFTYVFIISVMLSPLRRILPNERQGQLGHPKKKKKKQKKEKSKPKDDST